MSRGSLNKVQIIGNLGRDPEMRVTGQGKPVTNFSVATGGKWTDRDGNERDDTEWFRVEAWDGLAETCNSYLTKGTKVYIEGRLKTRKYTDKDGVERTSVDVVASNMVILSSRNNSGYQNDDDGGMDEIDEPPPPPRRAPAPAAPASRAVAQSASRSTASRAPMRNQPQPIENDDDIPF